MSDPYSWQQPVNDTDTDNHNHNLNHNHTHTHTHTHTHSYSGLDINHVSDDMLDNLLSRAKSSLINRMQLDKQQQSAVKHDSILNSVSLESGLKPLNHQINTLSNNASTSSSASSALELDLDHVQSKLLKPNGTGHDPSMAIAEAEYSLLKSSQSKKNHLVR